MALTTHLLALRLKKEYSCTATPPLGLHGMLQGELYFFILTSLDTNYAVAQLDNFNCSFQVVCYSKLTKSVEESSSEVYLAKQANLLPSWNTLLC
jgi:hypothetical protein